MSCPFHDDDRTPSLHVYGTPEEEKERGDMEAYCGGYDPSRVTEDGDYIPEPGC